MTEKKINKQKLEFAMQQYKKNVDDLALLEEMQLEIFNFRLQSMKKGKERNELLQKQIDQEKQIKDLKTIMSAVKGYISKLSKEV